MRVWKKSRAIASAKGHAAAKAPRPKHHLHFTCFERVKNSAKDNAPEAIVTLNTAPYRMALTESPIHAINKKAHAAAIVVLVMVSDLSYRLLLSSQNCTAD